MLTIPKPTIRDVQLFDPACCQSGGHHQVKVRGGEEPENRSEVTGPTHGHLIPAQVVDQRLHVGEDAFGVWFVTHDHHVFHLQQRHAVGVGPEEQAYRTACMRKQNRWKTSWEGEIIMFTTSFFFFFK